MSKPVQEERVAQLARWRNELRELRLRHAEDQRVVDRIAQEITEAWLDELRVLIGETNKSALLG